MEKRILNHSRIRCVHGGFAFIPHRFLTDGFIKRLEPTELLLYLLLVMVSDAFGLSYYGDAAICRLLRITPTDLRQCRQILVDEDLIVYEVPLYQVLELPLKPVPVKRQTKTTKSPASFSKLIERLKE